MASRLLSPKELTSNKFVALASYRHLLRATGIAFQGDNRMLRAARQQAYEKFSENRALESGSTEAGTAIELAQGIAQVLRENVVQGKNKSGTDIYKLNIHDDTQRLDNGTVKEFKGTTKSFKEIKNATF